MDKNIYKDILNKTFLGYAVFFLDIDEFKAIKGLYLKHITKNFIKNLNLSDIFHKKINFFKPGINLNKNEDDLIAFIKYNCENKVFLNKDAKIEQDYNNLKINLILLDDNHIAVVITDIFNKVIKKEESINKLSKAEKKFRLIFENSPLAIIHYNINGIITECNDNFLKKLGTTRDKIIGINMLELPDKRVVKALNYSITKKKISKIEIVYESVTSKKRFLQGLFLRQ